MKYLKYLLWLLLALLILGFLTFIWFFKIRSKERTYPVAPTVSTKIEPGETDDYNELKVIDKKQVTNFFKRMVGIIQPMERT